MIEDSKPIEVVKARDPVEQICPVADDRKGIGTPVAEYLKVGFASRYLGISANSLRKYTDLGLIKAKRLPGGDRLYKRAWLDQFVEELPDAVEVPEEKTTPTGGQCGGRL
jgi:hypothetical protein